jgi:DNA (cytosine-5)-methyltransferase 1
VNELALFAGAGGGILGGHLLGWRTVCAVEWEQYPASVLCARQNDKILPPFPIWDDVQTFDGKPWRGIVDVVSGGFPCQDISAAGGGAGITGERSGMWKHMARIISEVRPQYVFVENSPMLTSRGLGVVLADLSKMGFDAKWGVVSAADVGAPHLRERIWILATDTSFQRCNEWGGDWKERQFLHDINRDASKSEPERERWQRGVGEIGSDVADTRCKSKRTNERLRSQSKISIGQNFTEFCSEMANANEFGTQSQPSNKGKSSEWIDSSGIGNRNWWAAEPNVGRVADGVAARVDRLKAIGNGQVPLCAATAWELLK